MKTNHHYCLILVLFGVISVSFVEAAVPDTFENIISPTATVAIHVSETTKEHWNSLGGPHDEWQQWHCNAGVQ